jgi:hypothetical protein
MADTQRTLAALQALFADNTTGDISPQDLRDFLVSSQGGYGSIFVTGGSTAQVVSGTPVKMSGFATNGISSGTTPDNANDQITISVAGDYDIALLAGSFIGSNGSTPTLDIYINGSPSGLPTLTRTLGTPANPGSAATGGQLTLATNDIVTVFVSSTSTSFTPQEVTLKLKRIS